MDQRRVFDRVSGSGDLTTGGSRAFFRRRGRGNRVYDRLGEKINLGSSAHGAGSGSIGYAWPDGTTGACAASDEIINPTTRDGSRLVHENETPSRKRKA